MIADQPLRLRSLQIALAGKDHRAMANTLTIVVAAPLGVFISGGESSLAAGTLANAKTAADFTLPPPASAPSNIITREGSR